MRPATAKLLSRGGDEMSREDRTARLPHVSESEWITPEQFHAAEGVNDWRVLAAGVCTRFHTGTFPGAVELAAAIGAVAGLDGANPGLDVRPEGVLVQLRAVPGRGLRTSDIDLARRVSAVAAARGARPEPGTLQDVLVTVDARAAADIMPFWRAVLGYAQRGDEDLVDAFGRGPSFWFQAMDAPRSQRNRLHIDVFVPHDLAKARVAAALAAGGHLVSDEHAPSWWVVADSEGNQACVASWVGRG